MSRFNNFLLGLSRLSWSSPRFAVAIVVALLAVSPTALVRLRIDTDSARLLPGDSPLVESHRASRRLFGETSPLLLLVDAGTSREAAFDEFCGRLGEAVAGWPDMRLVVYRKPSAAVPDELTALVRVGIRQSPPSLIDGLTARLAADEMRRQLLRSRKKIVAADDPGLRELITSDLLGVVQTLGESLERSVGGLELSTTSPFLEAAGSRVRLIWLQPEGSAEDSAYCIELTDRIDAVVSATRSAVAGAESITVGVSGVHAITAESTQIMMRQMVVITLVSATLLAALLWFRFRDLRITALAIVPLLVAQVFTLVIAALFFNPVFAWSIGFVAIAMGLGLDVSLHLVARWVAHREAGATGLEAVEATMTDCGPPVTIGVVSTAAAFLAILLADSPGLDQFAMLTAIGLAVTLAVTLTLFPALARLLGAGGESVSTVSAPNPSAGIFASIARRARPAALLASVVVAASLPIAAGSRLDLGIDNLIPDDLETVRTGRQIVDAFGGSFLLTSQVLLTAPDIDLAARGQSVIDRRLAELRDAGRIAGFSSALGRLGASLPTQPDVATSIARLHRRLGETRGQFFALVDQAGFSDPQRFVAYFDALVAATRPLQPDSPDELLADPGARLTLARHDDGIALQSTFWPSAPRNRPAEPLDLDAAIRISDELRALPLDPGIELSITGVAEVYSHASATVFDDVRTISAVGLVLVITVVGAFLRSVRGGFLCLLPLLAALPMTAAAARVFGIPLTQTAPCLLAVVVGIGIDDAVHVVYRLRRGMSTARVLRQIGPVLSLTTASTMIGFGCLAMSDLEVLSSMGVNIAIGVAACWLATIFLLPGVATLVLDAGRQLSGPSSDLDGPAPD